MKRDCIVEELWRSIAVKGWRSVCSRILELVGTAFVFGVVLQIVQIVVFDTLDIDRMLGGLMWISFDCCACNRLYGSLLLLPQ